MTIVITHFAGKGMVLYMNNINIGFLGFGLIGGSIARAIKSKSPETVIQVYTRRKNPDLETGAKEGIIDHILYDIDEAFSSCDFIFLCAPILKNIDFLHKLKPFIKKDCILTDVGSVKGNIHKAVTELSLEENFIGGHPMAGSEKNGYKNSSAHLLNRCYYLLTPTQHTSSQNIKKLTEILKPTGCKCIILNPAEHDDITAAISHVPHIIAASLVNMVQKNDSENEYMKTFAAGGFKDITRIASSSPEIWENICLSNKESIDHFLACFIDSLSYFRKLIADEDSDRITQVFKNAADYRNSIKDKEDDS